MPQPKAKGGTNELQERYSKLTLAKTRKTMIFANLFNRDYEGDPTAGAVKIPVRDTEVKVNDYDVTNGVSMTQSATAYKTLAIDQEKAVNELIDGYEAAAVPDDLAADRVDSAGYSLGLTLDDALVTTALKGTGEAAGGTTPLTKDTIYENIVDTVAKAKKMGLRPNEMWLALTNETYATIVKAPQFIHATPAGDGTIANGLVGRINGVEVYETNNIPDTQKVEYILGNKIFCHFVDEWGTPVSINDLKDGKHIGASALQGRRVYGSDLSRPTTVFIKRNAPAPEAASLSDGLEIPAETPAKNSKSGK